MTRIIRILLFLIVYLTFVLLNILTLIERFELSAHGLTVHCSTYWAKSANKSYNKKSLNDLNSRSNIIDISVKFKIITNTRQPNILENIMVGSKFVRRLANFTMLGNTFNLNEIASKLHKSNKSLYQKLSHNYI